MGIRVHKAIGYGVRDPSKYIDLQKFMDERENDAKGNSYDMTFGQFLKWIKKHRKEIEELQPYYTR